MNQFHLNMINLALISETTLQRRLPSHVIIIIKDKCSTKIHGLSIINKLKAEYNFILKNSSPLKEIK